MNAPGAVAQQWNLQVGPIGPAGNLSPAQLIIAGPAYEVAMGQQADVALNQGCTALFTQHLTDCSAFCMLHRQMGYGWGRASLTHMMGGPNPNAVNWAAIAANMPNVRDAIFYAVLANSRPTVLTASFLAAVGVRFPFIPAANIWVYNNNVGAINFGIDWGAFAGEPN